MKVLSPTRRHAGMQGASRRGDVVFRCLGWMRALGTGTVLILLLQVAHSDLDRHLTAGTTTAQTLPDEAVLRT